MRRDDVDNADKRQDENESPVNKNAGKESKSRFVKTYVSCVIIPGIFLGMWDDITERHKVLNCRQFSPSEICVL